MRAFASRISPAAGLAPALWLATMLAGGAASALPPGRGWSTPEGLAHPNVRQFRAARFDTDSIGVPLLISSVLTDTSLVRGMEWGVFTWRDSSWEALHSVRGGINTPEPVIAAGFGHSLLWKMPDRPDAWVPLGFMRLHPEPSTPETVMITNSQSSEAAGAVRGQRRWVVRSQKLVPYDYGNLLRTAYSDTAGVWRELPTRGKNEWMCTVAPLTDTTAIVVYSTGTGLSWAIAGTGAWGDSGTVDPRFSLHPRLALREDGALWLLWAGGSDRQRSYVGVFADGAWTIVDSVSSVHASGTFLPAWCDLTRDRYGPPVLTWGDLGFGSTFQDVGMASFPSDTGWTAGEEIPGSWGLFLTPVVSRDRNGDAWFANDLRYYDSLIVVHTYTRATTSASTIAPAGPGRRVSWMLTEPAPGSWWTVQRARSDGPFEQVARVRADSSIALGWVDVTPAAGVLRYKLRRECLDVRYQWESPEVRWPLRSRRPIHFTQVAAPLVPGQSIELSGAAAGTVRLTLYDVQGRRVYEKRWQASGSGIDRIPFDAGRPVVSGVYFLRAVDAAGSVSAPSRIVLLR